MPPPDLAKLKAALAMTSIWESYEFKWASFMTGWPTRQQQESLAIVCNMVPALIDEIERLRGENETLKSDPTGSYAMGEQKIVGLLGTANAEIKRLRGEVAAAKKLGAAEWHEAKAEEWRKGYAGADNEMSFKHMAIAAELRKEPA